MWGIGEIAPAHEPDLVVELERLGRDPGRERPQRVDLLVVLPPGRHDLQRGHPSQGLDDLAEKDLEVRCLAGEPVQRLDHGAGVGSGKRLEEREQPLALHGPDEGAHLVRDDSPRPVGSRLIQQAEGIAHAAVGGAPEHPEGRWIGLDGLFPCDPVKLGRDLLDAQAPKSELEASREDGDREALGIGGGEQELDVRWRLLERLQERVEAVAREHVHLVDEVHLEAGPNRGILDVVEEIPRLLHPGAGSCVHLDEIDMAAFVDLAAGPALTAGLRRRTALAVQTLCEDPGDGGLAHPAGAREEVGVVQAVAFECVDEGAHDVFLAHDRVEVSRTPLAGQRLVGHRGASVGGVDW